jgi:hypothetical protein
MDSASAASMALLVNGQATATRVLADTAVQRAQEPVRCGKGSRGGVSGGCERE